MHGPCPLPCLADWSHRAKSIVQVCPAQARATWDELELMRLKESWYVTLVLRKRRRSTNWLVFVGLGSPLIVVVVERVSSQLFGRGWVVSLSSPSRAPFMCVACAVAVDSVGVVVAIVVVGPFGCLSLLLTKSLSMESQYKQSCAVVSPVMSFVRSLLDKG